MDNTHYIPRKYKLRDIIIDSKTSKWYIVVGHHCDNDIILFPAKSYNHPFEVICNNIGECKKNYYIVIQIFNPTIINGSLHHANWNLSHYSIGLNKRYAFIGVCGSECMKLELLE